MSPVPDVLGLEASEAERRLAQSGFSDVQARPSGRRREGVPRVIRQKTVGGKIELIVSHFKELDR